MCIGENPLPVYIAIVRLRATGAARGNAGLRLNVLNSIDFRVYLNGRKRQYFSTGQITNTNCLNIIPSVWIRIILTNTIIST